MKICEKFNLTWSSIYPNKNDFAFVDLDGYPDGELFRYYFSAFLLQDISEIKKRKLCKFSWNNKIGNRLENGSYDGSIGSIITSKADIHIRPMYYFIHSDQIDFSEVATSDRFATSHFISPRHKKFIGSSFEKLLDVLIPSTSFFDLLFFSNLFYLLSIISIFSFFKKYANFGNEISNRNRNFLKILSLSYVVFIFIISTLITNNIKTEKVIVDISDLVYSEETLMNSKRTICFAENGMEHNYFIEAPKNSLAKKIYKKLMSQNNTCFLIDGEELFFDNFEKVKNVYNFVFLFPDSLYTLLRSVANTLRNNMFSSTNIALFENLRSFYLSIKLPKVVKNFINQNMYLVLSQGFFIKSTRDFPASFFGKSAKMENFKVYKKLTDYIQDYTIIEDVNFKQISYLFNVYFSVLLTILIIFSFDLIIYRFFFARFFSSRALRLKRIVNTYFPDLS